MREQNKPKLKKEVKFDTEIKSVYHTVEVYRFCFKGKGQKGYEICLYNQKGQRTMSKKFQGDYAHVKMVGETVMMYDGVNCCIYTANGVKRFAGQFQDKILDIVPVGGINTYTVMNINGIQKVRLVKIEGGKEQWIRQTGWQSLLWQFLRSVSAMAIEKGFSGFVFLLLRQFLR